MSKIIALMPLKANSSRVPGKNFKSLHGKPLFRWMLDKLLICEEIAQVIINTDAQKELEEAGLPDSSKLLIRDRKQELCGDEVSMNLVIQDDVNNSDADIYLMTHTTNPFISLKTLQDAISTFRSSDNADSLFTVNRHQTRFYDKDCGAINHDPDNLIPTQELEPWLEENSCMYIFSRDSFNSTNARIGSAPLMYETNKLESVDIDEPQDWQLAEALAPVFSAE
ncbi:cytidylyltransferase domain-containing protein [Marinibactrum halimedae]|uniref:Acylneuraminate cytidylyltransferase n=1 Tax=Marinibactrum halimedae TaxID=1444977 RepID=A0AA37TAR7_9GAMM|nr:acylneuraminate cytidylyltransferase family protein [Marinibactrum halimedae]MCD9459840.1 acylneuraminate cytidylyltransferase family protein [Marinibactrum halimedae]GLS26966.1 acylneuraminate cytidylyltransferase [Marinibactrum halimedae]